MAELGTCEQPFGHTNPHPLNESAFDYPCVNWQPLGRYRKKPVVIEAAQWTDETDIYALAEWCGGEVDQECAGPPGPEGQDWGLFFIPTLEGSMEVAPYDWIIRGVEGEFYPCKPSIFEATYDPT